MAEDTYENLKKGMKVTKKYVAKIQDRNYAAIKAANEAIDYDFDVLDTEEGQEKYITTISDRVREHVKKMFKMGEVDELFLDELIRHLGGITRREIAEVIKGLGAEFEPDDIIRALEESRRRFEQSHYMGVGQKYVTKKEDVPYALKYLGIEEHVREGVSPTDLHELFRHGGKVPYRAIPHNLRKRKAKKKAE